jgi:hypothetical protein
LPETGGGGDMVVETRDGYELKEAMVPYGSDFEGKMAALRNKKQLFVACL